MECQPHIVCSTSLRAQAYTLSSLAIAQQVKNVASDENRLFLLEYFLEFADILLAGARIVAPQKKLFALVHISTSEDHLWNARDAIIGPS